jgi:hypothetical protein
MNDFAIVSESVETTVTKEDSEAVLCTVFRVAASKKGY